VERRFRLTRDSDIKRVRRSGKSHAHPLLVLIYSQNYSEQTRFAVSAGKSIGNAVERNRAKRLIRAALHPLLKEIQPGWDCLLLARKPLVNQNCSAANLALKDLLTKAGLVNVDTDEN
jgi:ribonuclease P protein component